MIEKFLLKSFIFRCEECSKCLETSFEEESEINDLLEDKMLIQCPCGGIALVLRD